MLFALLLAAGAADAQVISEPIYAQPASLWVATDGLIDDRPQAARERVVPGCENKAAKRSRACRVAALDDGLVSRDRTEEKLFEEAVDEAYRLERPR